MSLRAVVDSRKQDKNGIASGETLCQGKSMANQGGHNRTEQVGRRGRHERTWSGEGLNGNGRTATCRRPLSRDLSSSASLSPPLCRGVDKRYVAERASGPA